MGYKSELRDDLRDAVLWQPPSYKKRKQYVLRKELGRGAFGQVVAATWKTKGKKIDVAIKVLIKKEQLPWLDVQNEVRALAGLRHPNVVRLLDHFESRDKWYFTFELATGGELFQRIRLSRFTEKNAVNCVRQILSGVEYIHSRKIIHRDIKPENILYRTPEPDSPLVIADFGICALLSRPDELIQDTSGTVQYSSPQVILGEAHGLKTDIWSVGVLTYRLLSGSEAFRAPSEGELVHKILHTRMSFPDLAFTRVSDTAKEFCMALAQKEEDDRPSATEALKHPWLTVATPLDHDLTPGFNARAQWTKTFNIVKAANRMRLATSSSDSEGSWGTPSPPASAENTPRHKTMDLDSPMEQRGDNIFASNTPEFDLDGSDDESDGDSFHTASDGDEGPFTPDRTGDGDADPTSPGLLIDSTISPTGPTSDQTVETLSESIETKTKKKSPKKGSMGSSIKGMMGKLRL